MGRLVVPSKQQSIEAEEAETQPLNLSLVPSTQERSMVKRSETETVATTPKRIEPEKDLALVTDSVVLDPKTAPPTIPMPIPTSATTSQEILATPTIAKTLLLLIFGTKFDKIAT